MSKHTEAMRSLAVEMLVDGEDDLGAVRANYNGTIAGNRLAADRSIAAFGEDSKSAPPNPDLLVAFPTAKQVGLVVTGGRVIVFALGMAGKAKEYLGDVPLSGIAEVRVAVARLGPVVGFVMKSGAVVDFEILRGEDPADFLSSLEFLVGD